MVDPFPTAFFVMLAITVVGVAAGAGGATPTADTSFGDAMVRDYFQRQVRQIDEDWHNDIADLGTWQGRRPGRQRELRQMLGIEPLPPRTPLQATVTGRLEQPDYTVEKLHFQSMPGLYVTASLYLPKDAAGPLPAVLYLCGHSRRVHEGESLGAKTAYQRYGDWLARHGYVCLIIDTLHSGELPGMHRGTFAHDRWWWWNRGYTPAGVEVWNSMRALDYLASRPEVDPERLGVAGRSGGGGYSWYLSALDDRVRVAVPAAGITDLQSQVVDGVVATHCDCMFATNRYRWDFSRIAALSAPRPVLLVNGDHDHHFPFDGIRRLAEQVRAVYALFGREDAFQTLYGEAGHRDIPLFQQGGYEWLGRHLGGQLPGDDERFESPIEPVDLKVFDRLPEDAINAQIDECFIPLPSPPAPPDADRWPAQRREWVEALAEQSFAGWPREAGSLSVQQRVAASVDGLDLTVHEFASQGPVRLRLWRLSSAERGGAEPRVTLRVLDEQGWRQWLAALRSKIESSGLDPVLGPGGAAAGWPEPDAQAWVELTRGIREGRETLVLMAPRGIGPTTWSESDPGWAVRRGFHLLGQTVDGMRVWDVRRAVAAFGELPALAGRPVRLEAEGVMAGVALYASIDQPAVRELVLTALPATHRVGPILLNVRRVLDLPQALGLALDEQRKVVLREIEPDDWAWAEQLSEQLGLPAEALSYEPVQSLDASSMSHRESSDIKE